MAAFKPGEKVTLKSKHLGELSKYSCSSCESSIEVLLHLYPDETQGELREDFAIQFCWHCGTKFEGFAKVV